MTSSIISTIHTDLHLFPCLSVGQTASCTGALFAGWSTNGGTPRRTCNDGDSLLELTQTVKTLIHDLLDPNNK